MRSVDRKRARFGSVLAALAATLISMATASARAETTLLVVPGVSIDAVQLNSTAADVRGRLGTPLSSKQLRGALGTHELVFRYDALAATFAESDGAYRVIAISTASKHARLKNGVGVGTDVPTLRRHIRGIHCGSTSCTLGRTRPPGSRLTTFFLKKGRVQKIAVALAVNA